MLIDGATRLATSQLEQFRNIVTESGLLWREPLVNVSADDEVVFEWWHKENKITLYIKDGVQFIKVWGTDIENEMDDGFIQSPEEFLSVWKWLHGERL